MNFPRRNNREWQMVFSLHSSGNSIVVNQGNRRQSCEQGLLRVNAEKIINKNVLLIILVFLPRIGVEHSQALLDIWRWYSVPREFSFPCRPAIAPVAKSAVVLEWCRVVLEWCKSAVQLIEWDKKNWSVQFEIEIDVDIVQDKTVSRKALT